MIWITDMNVHEIDLNLLRVFDAVLHEKGVTPAAARLGLTQPAVSNALARLRKLLGDALFVRTPRGVDATPFARELAEPVRQALALLESALAHGPGFDPADVEYFVDQVEKVAAGTGDVTGTSSRRPGRALSFDELAKTQNCV